MSSTAPILGRTTHIPVEHVVVSSKRPYQQVIDTLEARLGPVVNWDEILHRLMDTRVSWEQLTRECETHIGSSGLTRFYQVGHPYLAALGKSSRATQYTIGNPLLASSMTRHTPEAALYAPFKLVVYQDEEGQTFVAYDRFSSLLAQYRHEELDRTAQEVQRKLEALVAEAIGEETSLALHTLAAGGHTISSEKQTVGSGKPDKTAGEIDLASGFVFLPDPYEARCTAPVFVSGAVRSSDPVQGVPRMGSR